MRALRSPRGVATAAGMAVGLLAVTASWAVATTVGLCVPRQEGSAVLTPKHGTCRKGYKLTKLGQEGTQGQRGAEGKPGAEGKSGAEGKVGPEGKAGPEGTAGLTSEEAAQLKAILPFIKFAASGVGGKATIVFSGVNVQVVNGEGKTDSVHGAGNLVIGYGENAGKNEHTGSHNLILGEEQTFTSYGGILAGFGNRITAPFAEVLDGYSNSASGEYAAVGAGDRNTANGTNGAWIGGGYLNISSGSSTAVSGGEENNAAGENGSIGGGFENSTTGTFAPSVSGGWANTAAGPIASSVEGGFKNTAEGLAASIFGGKEQTASKDYEAIP
jgi:Collagen triple helix repeat (20 copies)